MDNEGFISVEDNRGELWLYTFNWTANFWEVRAPIQNNAVIIPKLIDDLPPNCVAAVGGLISCLSFADSFFAIWFLERLNQSAQSIHLIGN